MNTKGLFFVVVLTIAACAAPTTAGDFMPIGLATPGTPTTVTPDASPLAPYASAQAPTAGMAVSAADIQALTLLILNVQNAGRERTWFTQQRNETPTLLTTSSDTLTTLASITLAAPVAVGDIVSGEIRAWGNCIASYKVDTYISEDGGGDTALTPEVRHAASPSGSDFDHLVLSFTRSVAAAGTFVVRLKGFTNDAGHPLNVYFTYRIFAQRGT